MITYASRKDLLLIAECHMRSFPNSVTSLLGKDVITGMLEWYLSAPNKFLFFIIDQGIVSGYCGGHIIDGSDDYGSATGMSQFGFNKAISAFIRKPWLLFHPEIRHRFPFIIKNVLRKTGMMKPKKKPNASHQLNEPLTAGLVVIGVRPELQGKGIGTILIKEFEAHAKHFGAMKIALSVRNNNTNAILAYQRNGFIIAEKSDVSSVMTKEIL